MNERKLPLGGLSSSALKWLAMGFMLLDHLWATIIPGNMWLTWLGRLAFPIFAFQIAEGYRHTHDLKAYKKRLLFWGLVSEIPFNLMMVSGVIYPFHQNVMFTFLLALYAMEGFDKGREQLQSWKGWLRMIGQPLLCYLIGSVTFVDYGGKGVLMAFGFYLLRNSKLGQLLLMILLNQVLMKGQYIPLELFGQSFSLQTQAFAVLALPLIWLYNGEKGKGPNIGYWFYPAHILVLSLITMFVL